MLVASSVAFVGSVKWRDSGAFTREDAALLAGQRAQVPGTTAGTRLVVVSRSGFDGAEALDVRLGPDELLAAFRR